MSGSDAGVRQSLSAFLFQLCSLRALVAFLSVWLLLRAPLPAWVHLLQEQVQARVFRLGLHLSDLPEPQSSITVIHVPDIEYERWLLDLPGAASLEQLLATGGEETVFGLVLERPLALLQPTSESLLQEIQQGRRTRDHLFQEAVALLARRESLVSTLKSPRLVLGLTDQGSHLFQRIPVQESFARYPLFLRNWLWPWPDPSAATVVSPGFQYFPIDSVARQQQRLALLEEHSVVPMFPLQFWAVASQTPAARAGADLHWRRDTGFMLGVAQVATSTRADIVPVYGALSGIRASMRQITLGAALAGDGISGWVLLGRDSSPVLEQVAQLIASLGDRAFMVEPPWWSALHKGLLCGLAVFLLLLHLMPLRWVLGISLVWLGGLTAVQLLGQVFGNLWLPVGDLLLLGGAGLVLMLVWRWQQQVLTGIHERADRACLALAEGFLAAGHLDLALRELEPCRTSDAILECLCRIADRHETAGAYAEALAVLQQLKRRKGRYKEVPERIKRLRACLLYQEQAHRAPAP